MSSQELRMRHPTPCALVYAQGSVVVSRSLGRVEIRYRARPHAPEAGPLTTAHVILGGGGLAPLLAERLLSDGELPRMWAREHAALPPGVEALPTGPGGALTPCFAAGAALYLLPGAPELPRAAACQAPARVVLLHAEAAPARADLADELPRFVAAVAPLFGPGAREGAFGEAFWAPTLAGEEPELEGDPDLPQPFAYTEDVVDALARMGRAPLSAAGRWRLPTTAPLTPRALARQLAAPLGLSGAIRAAGGRWSQLLGRRPAPAAVTPGEGGDPFRATFGGRATPLAAAARRTAAWAHATFTGAPA